MLEKDRMTKGQIYLLFYRCLAKKQVFYRGIKMTNFYLHSFNMSFCLKNIAIQIFNLSVDRTQHAVSLLSVDC